MLLVTNIRGGGPWLRVPRAQVPNPLHIRKAKTASREVNILPNQPANHSTHICTFKTENGLHRHLHLRHNPRPKQPELFPFGLLLVGKRRICRNASFKQEFKGELLSPGQIYKTWLKKRMLGWERERERRQELEYENLPFWVKNPEGVLEPG